MDPPSHPITHKRYSCLREEGLSMRTVLAKLQPIPNVGEFFSVSSLLSLFFFASIYRPSFPPQRYFFSLGI